MNVKGDFVCSLYQRHGASNHVALVRGNESEQKVELADLLWYCLYEAEAKPSHCHLPLGAPASPDTRAVPALTSAMVCMPLLEPALSEQKGTCSCLHWHDKNSPPNLLKPKA